MLNAVSVRIPRLTRVLALFVLLAAALVLTLAGGAPVARAVPAAQTPAQCGLVQVRGGGQLADPTAAGQAESCFVQAYKVCGPATLTVQIMGVDTVQTHTLSQLNRGPLCVIQDVSTLRVIPQPLGPPHTYTCTGLVERDGALVVTGCGEIGEISVPEPAGGLPTPAATPVATPQATPRPGGPPFADPAFARLWTRTDSLVANHTADRSWLWGPAPNTGALQEPYKEGPGGQHLVQYFDKSRMEINHPDGDPNSVFYVTNGLLVEDLISGRIQVGDSSYEVHPPAAINVVGDRDDPNAPTYLTFQAVANTVLGDHRAPNHTIRPTAATATLNRAGAVGDDPSKAQVPGVQYVYYAPSVGHNIPRVFWDFLNERGPVVVADHVAIAPLSDPWYYASGLPISEAYWVNVRVRGVPTAVLVQAYERRVLSYTPGNTPAFQVEMGNVGQHYYTWRYGGP